MAASPHLHPPQRCRLPLLPLLLPTQLMVAVVARGYQRAIMWAVAFGPPAAGSPSSSSSSERQEDGRDVFRQEVWLPMQLQVLEEGGTGASEVLHQQPAAPLRHKRKGSRVHRV